LRSAIVVETLSMTTATAPETLTGPPDVMLDLPDDGEPTTADRAALVAFDRLAAERLRADLATIAESERAAFVALFESVRTLMESSTDPVMVETVRLVLGLAQIPDPRSVSL